MKKHILAGISAVLLFSAPAMADSYGTFCEALDHLTRQEYFHATQKADIFYRGLRGNWFATLTSMFKTNLSKDEITLTQAVRDKKITAERALELLNVGALTNVRKELDRIERWNKRASDPISKYDVRLRLYIYDADLMLEVCVVDLNGTPRCIGVNLVDDQDDVKEAETRIRRVAGYPADSVEEYLKMKLPPECFEQKPAPKTEDTVADAPKNEDGSANKVDPPLTNCTNLPEQIKKKHKQQKIE